MAIKVSKKLNESKLNEYRTKKQPVQPQPTTIASAVDKAEKILDNPDVYSGGGDIEKALDRALQANRDEIEDGGRDYQNVLFVGEAGSGKTARINAWAKKHNINLITILASTMDDTDLGGVISGNMEKGTAVKLASTQFDALGEEKDAVLFLDEWNRAPSTVRGTLLNLIQKHEVPDPRVKGGQRHLDNFLFTVAAINPADANYNTDRLDDAELGRVRRVYVKSDSRNFLDYVTNTWNKKIEKAKTEGNDRKLKKYQGQLNLATTLLKNPKFMFDSKDDIERSHENEETGAGNGLVLNYRSFSNLLVSCDGTKDDFIDLWSDYCNADKLVIVKTILANYKDVDDKANDALKGGTESSVFKNKASTREERLDKLKSSLGI